MGVDFVAVGEAVTVGVEVVRIRLSGASVSGAADCVYDSAVCVNVFVAVCEAVTVAVGVVGVGGGCGVCI